MDIIRYFSHLFFQYPWKTTAAYFALEEWFFEDWTFARTGPNCSEWNLDILSYVKETAWAMLGL